MADAKAYPELEVAKHTTQESCWMIIDEKVYDVTKFLEDHPGGDDILLDSSGRDATREFEDVGHSADARAQLDELYIGDLRKPTDEEIAEAQEAAKQSGAKIPGGPGEAGATSIASTLAKWLFPLLLVGAAYLIRKYSAAQ